MSGIVASSSSGAPSWAPLDSLRSVALRLEEFLSSSERVFLETGERLQGLEGQAQRLVESCGKALELGSGHGQSSPADQLADELRRMEQQLALSREASGSSIAGLDQILARTKQLLRLEEPFRDIVQTLTILGVYTRIVSAGALGDGVETVATEVRRLGGLIEPEFKSLLDKVRALHRQASQARTQGEAFLGREGERSVSMLASTRDDLGSLRLLAASASAQAARANSASDRVVRTVAGILVSLQVHDLIRQTLEHVVAALREFEGGSEASELAGVAVLCRLQALQLRSAREQFSEALDRIAGHLRALAECGSELSTQTSQFGSGRDGSALLSRVGHGVTQTASLLRDHLTREQAMAAALGQVLASVDEMASSVRSIRAIGIQVKLLALNALVETARIGDEGRVFDVLAREMRDLSNEVGQRAVAVVGSLQEIEREAQAWIGGRAAELTTLRSDKDGILAGLDSVVQALHEHQRQLQASLELLGQGSGVLEREVQQLTHQLLQQVEVTQTLQLLEGELLALGAEAARRAGPTAQGLVSDRLTLAASRYTMESERLIHRSVLADGPAPAQAVLPRDPSSAELGDNVELF